MREVSLYNFFSDLTLEICTGIWKSTYLNDFAAYRDPSATGHLFSSQLYIFASKVEGTWLCYSCHWKVSSNVIYLYAAEIGNESVLILKLKKQSFKGVN